MIDAFILFITIIFYIYYKVTKVKNIKNYIIIFLIIQYLFLNSNPYNNDDVNKLYKLNKIDDKYKPVTESYNKKKIYEYPFILKPNICTGGSKGVKIINNDKELNEYIDQNDKDIIYQEYIDSEYEFTILYQRNPLSPDGKIINIHKRIYGRDEISKKNWDEEKDNKERNDLITPKLEYIINNISKNIPGFYIGRYDIRVRDIEDLKNGKIYILELNGQMGFDLSYCTYNLFKRYTVALIFILTRISYGALNILKGNIINPSSITL